MRPRPRDLPQPTVSSPQRGSPIPQLGNIFHSTNRTDSSPISLTRQGSEPSPDSEVFPSAPLELCLHLCRSRTFQTGQSPKPEAAFDISDPYDVPGSILAAEATFCQEVCGCVGRDHGLLRPTPLEQPVFPEERGGVEQTAWCRL